MRRFRSRPSSNLIRTTTLSPREKQVLIAAANGLTSKETGDLFGTSWNTVRTQRAWAVWKLDAKNLAHAIAIAMREGIIK